MSGAFLCQGTVGFEKIEKSGVSQVGLEPPIFRSATRRSGHCTLLGLFVWLREFGVSVGCPIDHIREGGGSNITYLTHL